MEQATIAKKLTGYLVTNWGQVLYVIISEAQHMQTLTASAQMQ